MSISENFCSFPHGRRGVHALLWSIFAFLFCLSTSRGCYFMKVEGFLIPINPFINAEESLGSSIIGLFGYEEIGRDSKNGFVCKPYSPAQLEFFVDKPWKAARAFAIISNVCSGITLLALIMSSCVTYHPIILQSLAGISFFGSFSIILTFLIFAGVLGDDPFNGGFYFGGAMAIFGCLASFITGLLMLQIQPPGSHNYVVREPNHTASTSRGSTRPINVTNAASPVTGKRNFPSAKRVVQPKVVPKQESAIGGNDDIEAFQPGTETITETILPDGTKKVVTTTIGTDGSTTITETIIRTE